MELQEELKLSAFEPDEALDFELAENHGFMDSFARELEEEVDQEDIAFKKANLHAKLNFIRKMEAPYKDYLIIRGEIKGFYQAPCRRCIIPSDEYMDAEFSACFIPAYFEKEPEFEDLDSIFTDNEEHDLYFHQKGKLDLKEFLHEQLFLKVNPFPLHAEDCKGLCSICGSNLNREGCQHMAQVEQVEGVTNDPPEKK